MTGILASLSSTDILTILNGTNTQKIAKASMDIALACLGFLKCFEKDEIAFGEKRQ